MDKNRHFHYVCLCVFAVVPFECAHSSLIIPVSVKRAKTRRENMITSASSSVSGDAIYTRYHICVNSNISSVTSPVAPRRWLPVRSHTESKLGLSTYQESVTGVFRCWPWNGSFLTHGHTHPHTLSLSLSLLSLSLSHTCKSCEGLADTSLSSSSEIVLTLIINRPYGCVCGRVCVYQ